MIYSHVLFVILRDIICCLLIGNIGNVILGLLLCLIFSLDTFLATLCISPSSFDAMIVLAAAAGPR
jgi:hypothetical protein